MRLLLSKQYWFLCAILLCMPIFLIFSFKLYSQYQDNVSIKQERFLSCQIDKIIDFMQDNDHYANNDINYNDPVLINNRIIIINGDISKSLGGAVIKKMIYLDSIDNTKPINIYLSTNGGNISSVFGIIDVLTSLTAKVNVYAFGSCYSAGTYLLASGTGKRYASANTILSVHMNTEIENPEDKYSFSAINNPRIINFWKHYCKLPKQWLENKGDSTYYLSPQDAPNYNIIDEVFADHNQALFSPAHAVGQATE